MAKPANLTFEAAAAVPTAGFEALHFLRKADIQPGKKVLIIGAGGSIGTFSVQLSRHFGAEVTGVDSTEKLDMLRSIGANPVIDYTREDYTNTGEIYDLIIDTPAPISLRNSESMVFECSSSSSQASIAPWAVMETIQFSER